MTVMEFITNFPLEVRGIGHDMSWHWAFWLQYWSRGQSLWSLHPEENGSNYYVHCNWFETKIERSTWNTFWNNSTIGQSPNRLCLFYTFDCYVTHSISLHVIQVQDVTSVTGEELENANIKIIIDKNQVSICSSNSFRALVICTLSIFTWLVMIAFGIGFTYL